MELSAEAAEALWGAQNAPNALTLEDYLLFSDSSSQQLVVTALRNANIEHTPLETTVGELLSAPSHPRNQQSVFVVAVPYGLLIEGGLESIPHIHQSMFLAVNALLQERSTDFIYQSDPARFEKEMFNIEHLAVLPETAKKAFAGHYLRELAEHGNITITVDEQGAPRTIEVLTHNASQDRMLMAGLNVFDLQKDSGAPWLRIDGPDTPILTTFSCDEGNINRFKEALSQKVWDGLVAAGVKRTAEDNLGALHQQGSQTPDTPNLP